MRQLGRRLSNIPDEPSHSRGARGKHKQEWLSRVDVVDMLEQLEVMNLQHATADEVLFSCPFPGHSSGDSKPSCYMNTGEREKSKATVFKCHGCGRSGNAISFVAEHENISKQEAANFLRMEYAGDWRPPADGSISKEFEKQWADHLERVSAGPHTPPVIPWERYHELFTTGPGVDWSEAAAQYDEPDCPEAISYLFDRGFTPVTLEEWGIGWDPRGSWLTIPIVNPDGDLVGVKGRAPDDKRKPKYKILGDRGRQRHYGFAHYEKSHVVVGLDKWPDYEGEWVFTEGELDPMALHQIGIPAFATGSAHLSEVQAKIIRDYCNGVVLFLDSDTAGENAIWGYERKDDTWSPGIVEKLSPFMSVRIVRKHRWDPAKMMQRGKIKAINKMISEARSWMALPQSRQLPL